MRNSIVITLIYFCLSSCNGQDNNTIKTSIKTSFPENINNIEDTDNGIIYLSYDNGNTWKNINSGLPQKISIGLGGLAISETILGVATKEYGVYLYNFSDSNWVNVPTADKIIKNNIGAMALFKNTIYVGTQHKGTFYSKDNGKTWLSQNKGLNNQTIRRFVELGDMFYVCTNDGFYSLNEKMKKWQLEYGYNSLQVNGATYFKGGIYIGTSKGVYKKQTDNKWTNILPNHSVHNISSDDEYLYAMTYNEYLLSSKDGANWHSIQDGLPENLYTFNVLSQNNMTFAGQWDGVYSKTKFNSTWGLSSKGVPEKFAATNLKSFNGILVITTSERKLKPGMTTEK
ncbi:MAG: hypothetical protein IPM98_05865 [Lewinellaceae bacterium]|nr:hypothetical protein [Lewinellaceae bacterium]